MNLYDVLIICKENLKKIMKRILRYVEKLLLLVNFFGVIFIVFSMFVLLIIRGIIFNVFDFNLGLNMVIFGVFLGRKERIIFVKFLNKVFFLCIR